MVAVSLTVFIFALGAYLWIEIDSRRMDKEEKKRKASHE